MLGVGRRKLLATRARSCIFFKWRRVSRHHHTESSLGPFKSVMKWFHFKTSRTISGKYYPLQLFKFTIKTFPPMSDRQLSEGEPSAKVGEPADYKAGGRDPNSTDEPAPPPRGPTRKQEGKSSCPEAFVVTTAPLTSSRGLLRHHRPPKVITAPPTPPHLWHHHGA